MLGKAFCIFPITLGRIDIPNNGLDYLIVS